MKFRAVSTFRSNVSFEGELHTRDHKKVNAAVKAKLVEGMRNGEFREGEPFRVFHLGEEGKVLDAWTMKAKEGRKAKAKKAAPKAKKAAPKAKKAKTRSALKRKVG